MASDKKVLSPGNLGSDWVSESFDLYYYNGYSLEIRLEGNPKGLIVVQSANFPEIINDWHTIPDTDFKVNGPIGILFNFKEVNYRHCRIKYIHIDGDGVLKANIVAKGRS